MTTIHDPLDYICGDTWELTGPLQDADCDSLDLTGAAVAWRLDSIDAGTNYIALALGSGIVITDMPSATILVTVPASSTAALAAGNYRDSLRVTLADGTVFTEWSGIIRAAANPT